MNLPASIIFYWTRINKLANFAWVVPTVCVTSVGWAGWRLEMWKKLEARKILESRADSPASGARFVRPHGWRKKLTDEKMYLGRRHYTPQGRQPRQKTCRYYKTIAGKKPQPKRPLPTQSTWRSRLQLARKCHQADQLVTKKKLAARKMQGARHGRKNDCRENPIASKTKKPHLTSDTVSKEKKNMRSNGLRYPRWGGDGEAVRLEKC